MRTSIALAAALSAALLAGCGSNPSVSKNQCLANDWQTLGYRDGVNGRRSTELLKHQDACLKHGVTPDRQQYTMGWQQGVREYCTPNNAFYIGETGAGHYNICPADQATAFLDAYQNGRDLYRARSAVVRIENQISKAEYRIEAIKTQIVASSTAQLDPELTADRRVTLLAETARLVDEKAKLERELPSLRFELQEKRRELDRVSAALAASY